MTILNLQDANHHFTIAAFDHRGSLIKLLGFDEGNTEELTRQMIELKQLFFDVFAPYASAVLIDPIYGRQTLDERFLGGVYPANDQALNDKKSGNDDSIKPGVLLSLEESSYEGDKGGLLTEGLQKQLR